VRVLVRAYRTREEVCQRLALSLRLLQIG
jgi:hypothetical protein